MIDIKVLQEYYNQDKIIISAHALERCRRRGIKQKDIRNCIFSGEIIEQYPEVIYGYAIDGRILHVVASDEGTASRIITAYIPNTDKFEEDLKTRREQKE